MALREKKKALEVLERYTELVCGDIYPARLKGDEYFDLLDDWFEQKLSLGEYLSRDDAVFWVLIRRWSVYMICGMIFKMRIFRRIHRMTQEEDYV